MWGVDGEVMGKEKCGLWGAKAVVGRMRASCCDRWVTRAQRYLEYLGC